MGEFRGALGPHGTARRRARSAYERAIGRLVADEATGCHLWPGANDGKGYGRVRAANNGPVLYVHRVVWEHLHGPIPPGMQIDHLCRVHNCANPEHLEMVTPSENNRRKPSTTHCRAGHEWVLFGRRRGDRWDCVPCTAQRVRRHRAAKENS